MKLFIYTATEEIPFEGLFEPIGSYEKIILSNNDKQIKLFLRHNGLPIKDLLPDSISDDDNRLFFIPIEMKDMFMKLFDSLFKQTKWVKDKNTQKPSKEKIGLVGEDELSSFYDQIETEAVLKPLTEDTVEKAEAKQKLLELFNTIATEDNEIDAVLVSIYDGNRTRVAYSSDPKQERRVDSDSFAIQLKDLISLISKTKKVNPDVGLFDNAVFQYAPAGESSGSIIHVSHLSQYGDYTFLIFVSATADGIEMLELYRNRNLPKIKELLEVLIGN
jgi:hypothetical protein